WPVDVADDGRRDVQRPPSARVWLWMDAPVGVEYEDLSASRTRDRKLWVERPLLIVQDDEVRGSHPVVGILADPILGDEEVEAAVVAEAACRDFEVAKPFAVDVQPLKPALVVQHPVQVGCLVLELVRVRGRRPRRWVPIAGGLVSEEEVEAAEMIHRRAEIGAVDSNLRCRSWVRSVAWIGVLRQLAEAKRARPLKLVARRMGRFG